MRALTDAAVSLIARSSISLFAMARLFNSAKRTPSRTYVCALLLVQGLPHCSHQVVLAIRLAQQTHHAPQSFGVRKPPTREARGEEHLRPWTTSDDLACERDAVHPAGQHNIGKDEVHAV